MYINHPTHYSLWSDCQPSVFTVSLFSDYLFSLISTVCIVMLIYFTGVSLQSEILSTMRMKAEKARLVSADIGEE